MTYAAALPLPGLIQRRADRMAHAFLNPDPARAFDFATPKGAPALVAADSVSWRVFKNPLPLFIGGVAAVLLEFADPRVRDGVWDHSTFRQDAVTRMRRTGLAAMVTVYGARSRAEAMIAGVVRAHGRVVGQTSEGQAYSANYPELLDWVQATAGYGFMEACHRFARPLAGAERDALFQEAEPAARLYGAVGAPRSEAELQNLFQRTRPLMRPSPVVFEFLDIMRNAPVLPAAARPFQRMLLKASVDILPSWTREVLQLGPRWSLSGPERMIIKAAARASDRIILPSSPAVQSCRRLGLPDDWLY